MAEVTRLWERDLGLWCLVNTKWFRLHGSTPRNADIWFLNIGLGSFHIWMGTGPHRFFEIHDKNYNEIWSATRNKPDCTCYGCRMYRHPNWTPEEIAWLRERLEQDAE